ncbi:uncharacterized protein LOC119454164 isoform X2 [Dermacentor silvarum]|uniref:uncharacterized protein LOC119454164 isoform X2 n=1 Tax=Dermacentor silvarum TaxID=543639 RepID=UPI002101B948|nr:uncharacterized protein LOC119454164 isoform X2 [Dermacentor silvarum]
MNFAQIFLVVCLLTASCSFRACHGETKPEARNDGTTATTGTESEYNEDNCIEITLPNILQIDECLGDNLNLCKGKTTLTEGVLSLANCTVSGVVRNLSLVKALVTVKDLLVALLGKLVPSLGTVLNGLDLLSPLASKDIKDNVCYGDIKITVPNSLGKCVDDTLKLCKNGTTIDTSIVESLVKTVGCIVKDLFTTPPDQTVSNLLCDIARTLSVVLGKVPGGGILSKPVTQICESK